MKNILYMILILLHIGGVSASSSGTGSGGGSLEGELSWLQSLNSSFRFVIPKKEDVRTHLEEVNRIFKKYVNHRTTNLEIAQVALRIYAQVVEWQFPGENKNKENGLAQGDEVRTIAWRGLLKAARFGRTRIAPEMLSLIEVLGLEDIANRVKADFPFFQKIIMVRKGETYDDGYGTRETASEHIMETIVTGSILPPRKAETFLEDLRRARSAKFLMEIASAAHTH